MNCPKCGKELSPGILMPGENCNLEWAPGHGQFPLPRRGRAVLKPIPPRDPLFDVPEYPAYLCADCKTVIFEYE